MSLRYAEKLTPLDDVGDVGMCEIFDPPSLLQEKIEELAAMIKRSKHLVVLTGAGISTACGIPDFRGPKGIWTLQREGKAFPEASLPFHRAMPSVTHMALVELEKAGILKFLISQNIDGLHLRSGIPRKKLSELHGNSFMEFCPSCRNEYLRDFEIETVGMKKTPRKCSNVTCGARLNDTVIDFQNVLPAEELDIAMKNCQKADVVLCLGTSLLISPACDLPLKCLKRRGKVVIVNLQETPKDKCARLVIRGAVDKVIGGVIDLLSMRIPPFVRIDLLQIVFTQGMSMDKRYMNWNLRIGSVHGIKDPLPFIRSVEVSFSEGHQNMKKAFLHKQPLVLKRRIASATKPFHIFLKLNLVEGCGCTCVQISVPVNFEVAAECCKRDKEVVLQKLRNEAVQDFLCGRCEVIERKVSLVPKCETTVYAIVTNVVVYDKVSASSHSTPEMQEESSDKNQVSRKRQKAAPA